MAWADDIAMALLFAFVGFHVARSFERGRRQWLTPVGRPPRDLFADRRVNFIFNAVHEWLWIGFSVIVASFFMIFFDATDGLVDYVFWLGAGMMLACLIIVPFCVARAELNPKYEAETLASPS